MNETTLEQYFIEDYKRLKAENDELKVKLAAFEANAGNHEYGITDLHQRSKAVKGSVISEYYVDARLRDGDLDEAEVRDWLEWDDEKLFEHVRGRNANYTTLLSFEEHEFQYTLFVKESRTEWAAVSDGKVNSGLLTISDGEFYENEWFAFERKDEFKAWLVEAFRESLRGGLERHEARKAKEGAE